MIFFFLIKFKQPLTVINNMQHIFNNINKCIRHSFHPQSNSNLDLHTVERSNLENTKSTDFFKFLFCITFLRNNTYKLETNSCLLTGRSTGSAKICMVRQIMGLTKLVSFSSLIRHAYNNIYHSLSREHNNIFLQQQRLHRQGKGCQTHLDLT